MSDYLNQKMEGLKKAFDAHWGEVMNRDMGEPFTFESLSKTLAEIESMPKAPHVTAYVNLSSLTLNEAKQLYALSVCGGVTFVNSRAIPEKTLVCVAEDPLETECKEALKASQSPAHDERDLQDADTR